MKQFLSRIFYQKPEKIFLLIADHKDAPRVRLTAALLILLPAGVYFYLIHSHCVNIPYKDDFSFLIFANAMVSAESLPQAGNLFFEQLNEHRIAVPRLIFFLLLKTTSQVDYKTAIYIGNLSLVGLLFIFYKIMPPGKRQWIYLIPASFMIFHLQHWENTASAVGSLSNFIAMGFAGAAFYFLNRKNTSVSILFAALTVCTSGIGFFVLVAGAITSLLAGEKRHALFWLGASLIIAFLYFLNYTKPAHHPGVLETLFHPATLFLYFISFIGTLFSADNYYLVPLAPLGGAMGVGYFIYLTWKKYYRSNPGMYGFMLFLILLGMAAALSRTGFGMSQVFTSRYKIFSAVYWALACLSLLDYLPAGKEKLRTAVCCTMTLIAVTLNIWSYPRNFDNFHYYTKQLTFNVRHWVMNQEGANMGYVHIDDRIMTEALNNGIYRFSCNEVNLRKQDRDKWC
jgi:hypothetical protein